jgi:hypothetical protein
LAGVRTGTPLITAASSGDAEVARALTGIGAGIDAISAPGSGGVPDGTALQHAAVSGMTDVVDVLVAAGAKIHSLEMAATAGGITGWPLHRLTLQSRLRALVSAAGHQRLEVIDRLVAAGTPRSTSPAPDASGCRCTPRQATAAAPASGHCSPAAPAPASATPPHWRKASGKAAASRRTPSCGRRPAGPAASASRTSPARRNPTGPEPARKRRETTVQVGDLRHGTRSSSAASSISLGRYSQVTAGRYQRP